MRRRRENPIIGLMKPASVLLLLFMVFGIVWLRSSVVSLEYSLSGLEKKRADLMRERKTLSAEQANLLYIGRLRNVASDGIGLEFPDRVRVVYVKTPADRGVYKTSFHVRNAGSDDVRSE